MNQTGLLRWLAALAIILTISGCGGGGNSTAGVATAVTLTPATLSLDFGQVSSISVSVTDASGNVLTTPTTTFQSDKPSVATVSASGLVCAGTWDSLTTPVVCTPTNTSGTANITAVAAGITSSATAVTTHPRIASLTISAPAAACVSDAKTSQFTATGKDSAGNPIALIGTPTWTSTNTSVASIDANGLATAKVPGLSTVFATLNGVSSLPATFTTCPPSAITLATADATSPTATTLAPATTAQLTASATDTLGNPMPDLPAVLTFSSSQPTVASVGATGLVTAVAAGNTAIIASCTPPTCNSGLTPIYSNTVTASVTGTSSSTVYVTGANATSVIPIDTTTNTPGTAITIPQISSAQPVVNSFVFNKAGTKAYIGTNLGLLILDPTVNAFAAPVLLPGKVLGVSPSGIKVVIAAQNGTQVYVFDTGTSGTDVLAITGASAADFPPDSSKVFIVAGSNLYVVPPANPLILKALAAPATDVTFLSQGSAAYLAGGSPGGINVRATCDNSSIADLSAAPPPTPIRSTFDSKHVIGANTTNIYDVAVTIASSVCPPAPTNTVTAVALGAAPTVVNQLIVSPDATRAFVLTDLTSVLQYNTGSGTAPAQIALTGGAPTTGGMTLDGKNLYVGISGTNNVQRIDTSSSVAVATTPIALGVNISPDFVVVRPK